MSQNLGVKLELIVFVQLVVSQILNPNKNRGGVNEVPSADDEGERMSPTTSARATIDLLRSPRILHVFPETLCFDYNKSLIALSSQTPHGLFEHLTVSFGTKETRYVCEKFATC